MLSFLKSAGRKSYNSIPQISSEDQLWAYSSVGYIGKISTQRRD